MRQLKGILLEVVGAIGALIVVSFIVGMFFIDSLRGKVDVRDKRSV